MSKLFLIFICFLSSNLLIAQSSIEFIQQGDVAFRNGDYLTASIYYKKAIENGSSGKKGFIAPYDLHSYYILPKKNETTPLSSSVENKNLAADSSNSLASQQLIYSYVVHQLGECYRLIYDYDNAELYYGKSIKVNNDSLDRYWYGQMLMRNEKYSEAAIELETFMKTYKNVESNYYKKADRDMAGCKIAVSNPPNPQGIFVNLEDAAINSGVSSFAASFFQDTAKLIFSLEKNMIQGKEDKTKEAGPLDLYTSSRNGKQWGSAIKLPEPVNSPDFNEGAPSIVVSEDDTTLFFTRFSERTNEYAIYMVRFTSGRWFTPMKLNSNVNVPGYRSIQPFITPDGKVLYFISDRPDGKGGLDVWACRLDEKGNTGQAFNLGERINSPHDEQTPFYNVETSTLYFSSDGRIGFGGLDIYKSSGLGINWSVPLNLGRPINSGKDDAYFILNKREEYGFLSSDRKKCTTCEGGNCYAIYKVKNNPVYITVSGKVLNKMTNEIIPNALVTITTPENKEPIFIVSDDNGEYTFAAKENTSYELKGQKVKYFSTLDTVSIGKVNETQDFNNDIFLKPITEGEEIVIPGIEYDYNKANLRPASKDILDEFLVPLLEINVNMSIEIGSHSDARGGDDYNLRLSEARAKSVVDYLISKGIAGERLTFRGYGETKPLVPDAVTEEEHQRNRRTAFTVISFEKPKAIKK